MALPIEPILGALAIFMPLVIASALGATIGFPAFTAPSLDFSSPHSMLSSGASVASTFLDPGCVGDNAAIQTGMEATLLGAAAVIVAALLFFSGIGWAAPTVSLALSLVAMYFLLSADNLLGTETTQQIQANLAIGTILAFLAFGADALALLSVVSSLPQAAILVGVSIGLDLGGLYLGTTIRNNPC
jgi:hypothetical protein